MVNDYGIEIQPSPDMVTIPLSDYEELMKRVKELEAKQPKWISVKDRMPDKHKQVLVYGWGFANKKYKVYFIKIAELRWNCTYGRAEFDCDGEVSHWMPLPEAPDEG